MLIFTVKMLKVLDFILDLILWKNILIIILKLKNKISEFKGVLYVAIFSTFKLSSVITFFHYYT